MTLEGAEIREDGRSECRDSPVILKTVSECPHVFCSVFTTHPPPLTLEHIEGGQWVPTLSGPSTKGH